jgi:hypothetical protein
MKLKRMKHWQDVVSVLVAVWLMASPWVLGFSHANLAAVGNCVMIGAVLFAFEMVELFVPESWEEYSELVMGAWLIGSPWVLEFTGVQVAKQNAMAVGVITCLLALWVLVTDDEFGWFHHRVSH